VTYDEMAGRFVIVVLDLDVPGRHSYLNLAVSDTSNPLDGFHEMHRLETTEPASSGSGLTWGDYPKLGFNADAYVVTLNMDLFPDDTVRDHSQVVTFDKSTLLDADPSTVTVYRADLAGPIYAPAAATMHGAKPGGPMYFVQESTRFGGDH